jgi:hypothetical protein
VRGRYVSLLKHDEGIGGEHPTNTYDVKVRVKCGGIEPVVRLADRLGSDRAIEPYPTIWRVWSIGMTQWFRHRTQHKAHLVVKLVPEDSSELFKLFESIRFHPSDSRMADLNTNPSVAKSCDRPLRLFGHTGVGEPRTEDICGFPSPLRTRQAPTESRRRSSQQFSELASPSERRLVAKNTFQRFVKNGNFMVVIVEPIEPK